MSGSPEEPFALELTPDVRSRVEALGHGLREALARAAELALHLHAEEVTVEHLLVAMMRDESTGAARLVISAFADPETLAVELTALCPGITVVGSGRSLPFSVRGVRAVEATRERARRRGASSITPADVLLAALEELPAELARRLREAGLSATELPRPAGGVRGDVVPAEGHLFRHFSSDARRALGAACRIAGGEGLTAISPAHLVQGALESDELLTREVGFDAPAARRVLRGSGEDPTPLPRRALGVDEALTRLLASLDPGAGTGDLLAHVVEEGHEELRLLFAQQKITPALCRHARERFADAPSGPRPLPRESR